jgi:hypothetical protein
MQQSHVLIDLRSLFQVSKKQTDKVSKLTGWLEIWYSLGGHVHNWVKWPEREFDDKTYKVEILSGAIILSLYMSVLSI